MADLATIPLKKIDGAPASIGDYKGSVLLIVNVASKCGLTPQYEGLEKLYKDYRAKGLVVLGFPANDFKGQEPGTNEEIASFCTLNYGVDFPMFEKLKATGADKHPLYAALTSAKPVAKGNDGFRTMLTERGFLASNDPADVLWNFEKFLIGRDGQVVERFTPDTKPDDPAIISAIEAELAK